MRTINDTIIKEFITAGTSEPAVTIYAPMHTTASPQHVSQNQRRLKKLIHAASAKLTKEYGASNPLIAELASWHDLHQDDMDFWNSQTTGFLLCAQQRQVHWFNLPIETDEYIAVDTSLHLAPVLAMLVHDQEYYVLTVDQHSPKLFKGNAYELRMSPIALPASLDAALGIDEVGQKGESQGSASGSSLNTGLFNGRGGNRDPHEEDRHKFFRMIDRLICDKDKVRLPLILAGTISETSEYRALSKYPHLAHKTINGSHSDNNMEALHRQALDIIDQELIQPARQAALEEYRQLEGVTPQKVAGDVESIAIATREGRVATLLTSMSSETADSIQDGLQPVHKISLPAGEKGKLLNNLALKVWQMRGTVINLRPQDMPGGASMVAQLRY